MNTLTITHKRNIVKLLELYSPGYSPGQMISARAFAKSVIVKNIVVYPSCKVIVTENHTGQTPFCARCGIYHESSFVISGNNMYQKCRRGRSKNILVGEPECVIKDLY